MQTAIELLIQSRKITIQNLIDLRMKIMSIIQFTQRETTAASLISLLLPLLTKKSIKLPNLIKRIETLSHNIQIKREDWELNLTN